MIEILPIKVLDETDAPIFGSVGVLLGELTRNGFPIIKGIVITPPKLYLKTILESKDFGRKEVFEQSLIIVKKEIENIPIPQILYTETKGQKKFLLNNEEIATVTNLWKKLINIWLVEIKQQIWRQGFTAGLTENLTPQIVGFIKEIKTLGKAQFNPYLDDVEIELKTGALQPKDLKKMEELVVSANKKLFIPHVFEWVYDNQLLISGIYPYTPKIDEQQPKPKSVYLEYPTTLQHSSVKIFYDLTENISQNTILPLSLAGLYFNSEKIINEFKLRESIEDLTLKLVQACSLANNKQVLFKLPDLIENTTGIRGSLRLIHQKSLLKSISDAFLFVRNKYVKIADHKKEFGFKNIQLVIPFVRNTTELLEIKRDLAVNKIMRKNSLEFWLELAVPENIINLENYLLIGLDGVVLNLDEMLSHLGGFNLSHEELSIYKKQVDVLINFLEDGIKLLHKSKVKFIVTGDLVLNPDVLEFLVSKGVYSVVVKQYEVHSAVDLLNLTEKRVIRKAAGLV